MASKPSRLSISLTTRFSSGVITDLYVRIRVRKSVRFSITSNRVISLFISWYSLEESMFCYPTSIEGKRREGSGGPGTIVSTPMTSGVSSVTTRSVIPSM